MKTQKKRHNNVERKEMKKRHRQKERNWNRVKGDENKRVNKKLSHFSSFLLPTGWCCYFDFAAVCVDVGVDVDGENFQICKTSIRPFNWDV